MENLERSSRIGFVGLGAMEWHMQMALEHIRKNSIG